MRRISVRKLVLAVVATLALVVVVLNWTYGRLPAEPKPAGSFIRVGKLRIRCLERPGPGPPVVLIHGLPGTADDFDEITPLLAGYRTPVDGLYLCGSSNHGGGANGAPGYNAANVIAGDLKLDRFWTPIAQPEWHG